MMGLDTIDKTEKNEGQGQADPHNGRAALADTTVDPVGMGLTDQMHQAQREPLEPHKNVKTRDKYTIALVSVFIAFLVRWSVDSYLNDAFPFATFLIAVAITAWYGGIGLSFMALALGGLISNWFFVRPRYEFALTGLIDQAGMVVYVTIGFATIGFIQTWRWAWQKTETMAKELQNSMTNSSSTEEKPSRSGSIASEPVSQREL